MDSMDRFRDRHQKGALLDDDDDLQDYELRKLKTKKYRDNPIPYDPYVEYDIQPDDTLHGICLRYACSINLVKRLNGLISDQDFHGLRKIKLPLGKLGLLDDVLNGQVSNLDSQDPFQSTQENQSARRDINSPGSALREFPITDDTSLLSSPTDIRFLTQPTTCDDPDDARFEVGQVFQDLDYHIERVKAATGSYDQRAVDLTSEFENHHNQLPTTTTSTTSRMPELFFCDETFGLNLRKLIIIIFVICLLTPLIYIQTITQAPNRSN